MDMGELFDHLDDIERRERPLRPIRDELREDKAYTITEQSCPVSSCSGALWDGHNILVCGVCSAVKDTSSSLTPNEDLWENFQQDRPRYPNSNMRRQVGGFNHEWLERDDADSPIADVDPEEFYRP